ncbi:MAG: hypothetical protein ACLQVL_22530 [Terriglobia bacterium]
MAYEVFTRKVPRTGTPFLSFSKIGTFAFNQTASRILQKETIEHVLLLWDATANKLAVKTTSNKKDPRAYRIRYNDKGNGATFSAKTFLDYVGIDYSERKPLPIEITPNSEYIVEVKIPDELMKKKHPKLVEKVKAG